MPAPTSKKQPAASPVRVTYQGEPGANSHIAAREVFPAGEPVACPTFEEALQLVKPGEAQRAMIPIENSVAGRVADIHHLLPDSGLFIIGEHFLRVRHQLMALPGVKLKDVTQVFSHVQALGQCRNTLRKLGLKPVVAADTAGSARWLAQTQDKTSAAIASELAAEIYGLDILKRDIEDETHNTTRFVILASEPVAVKPGTGPFVTTLVFRVRNVPAALYKAMGGFATNGVNITKLESYQLGGTFSATMFYADIEGHPGDRLVQLALEELSFFSSEVRVLGTYPASSFRAGIASAAAGAQ
jgi:prephenate dehydratase